MAQFWQRQKIYAQVTALGPLGGRWRSHHVRPRLRQIAPVAVGTALADGPPHRSQRAELPHWAPASGSGGEGDARVGAHDAGRRQPRRSDPVVPIPSHSVPLAATPKRLEPVPPDLLTESRGRVDVAWHGVVVQVPAREWASGGAAEAQPSTASASPPSSS